MRLVLDGVMLIGAVGTLPSPTVPVGSRVAAWGWTDGRHADVHLDGVAVPLARNLERPDVPTPGRGFATLLPRHLLTAGRHRIEVSADGEQESTEFDVAPFGRGDPHVGRIDDVRIGESTFVRAGETRFELPLGGPLLVEGWTTPTGAQAPWFLMRVGEFDIVGELSIDRPDVVTAHPAIPLQCGFATFVQADMLALGSQDVLLAVPRAADAWMVTDTIVFRGVARGSLPVFLRVEPNRQFGAAVCTVYESDVDVLFIVDGIPVGGYRSAVEPGVFRVDPRYATHDGLIALELPAGSSVPTGSASAAQ